MLKVGDKAPGFALSDADGKIVKLDDFSGKQLVLYFYPRDDTPGCTTEACGFRDVYDAILQRGAAVVGISPDKPDAHKKFREKYQLPFHLLCDSDHIVLESYAAWGEKNMYGKKSMGVIRSTFIIDAQGNIKRNFPKVSPEGHAQAVLDALE